MFGPSFFGASHYGADYFPPSGSFVPEEPTVGGGQGRRRTYDPYWHERRKKKELPDTLRERILQDDQEVMDFIQILAATGILDEL